MTRASDVLVVGAGVIGLSIAWRCLQRGLAVTVVDDAPGSGASWTAAGMLAPVTELHFGEQALLTLNLDSAARYPAFVAELREAAGTDVGYRRCGTVAAAWDAADLAALRDLHDFAATLGRDTQLLSGRELRALVPMLAAGLPGGLLAVEDHQVDNRLLHSALLTAVRRAGGVLVTDRVLALDLAGERAIGATLAGGATVAAGITVLAAGAWSRQLGGIGVDDLPPVRPVKGQTLRLKLAGEPAADGGPVVRGTVKGSPVYLVTRADGRMVVGASNEEAGFDQRSRAGAVYELLRDAQSLIPLISEAELEEVSTSLRPGSPDNAPIIGESQVPGLIFATGHYRNGILLTPTTADTVAALIADGVVAEVIAGFGPSRFRSGGSGPLRRLAMQGSIG